MNIELIENTIEKLESIISCKIITDNDNNFEEIHVVSNGTRAAKQIVRDIQSVLVATYNIQPDHKKISIAEIQDESLKRAQSRLRIASVSHENKGQKSTVKVTLENHKRMFENLATGINTSRNIDRMLIDATLRTVEEAYGYGEVFVFEDIKTVNISTEKVLVVVITCIKGGVEQKLCGSSLVKPNHMEAVVKATLDALNRYTTH